MLNKIVATFLNLRVDRRGASAIEYGLIAAGIALAVAATIPEIRTNLTAIFQAIRDQLVLPT